MRWMNIGLIYPEDPLCMYLENHGAKILGRRKRRKNEAQCNEPLELRRETEKGNFFCD